MEEIKRERPICPFAYLLERLASSECGKHLLFAKKEILLGIRAILDKKIEEIDRLTAKKEEPKKVEIK